MRGPGMAKCKRRSIWKREMASSSLSSSFFLLVIADANAVRNARVLVSKRVRERDERHKHPGRKRPEVCPSFI